MKELWSYRAARARSSPRRCRRRAASAFVGDLDRHFRAFDVEDRPGAVADAARRPRCRDSRCRSAADGKQYIAVTTGLGGGSPRQVPRAISPEIKHPNYGHALYVFELPKK